MPTLHRHPRSHPARPRLSAGFTLIELMITVAIVAVLARIAVPAYTNYVKRGRIVEATSNLAMLQAQMEQFYMDKRSWADAKDSTKGGVKGCISDTTYNNGFKHFDFSCDGTPTATAYTLQAVGKTGGSMAGFTFKLDQAGTKSTTAVPSGWTTSTTCWVTNKNGSC
jgi:type IV pilus assembly protein PilE